MAVAKRAKDPVDVDALVESARDALERDGLIKIASLGPKHVRPALIDALLAQGFEATKTALRRPIGAQLIDACADGQHVPLKRITAFVRGATGAEAKRAALGLVREGVLTLVLRGTEEVLVAKGADVLSRDELGRARRALESLGKVLAKAARQKQGATLLRSDVMGALDELRDGHPARPVKPRAQGKPTNLERVLEMVDATRDGEVGLSFVPRVVMQLRSEMPPETVRQTLLDAEARGYIELRPEGGLGRLSEEELAACLPGPQGTRLSWARRIEGRPS